MAHNVMNTKSYRRRRLATRIKEIKKLARRGRCGLANRAYRETLALDFTKEIGSKTWRSLHRVVEKCFRNRKK